MFNKISFIQYIFLATMTYNTFNFQDCIFTYSTYYSFICNIIYLHSSLFFLQFEYYSFTCSIKISHCKDYVGNSIFFQN